MVALHVEIRSRAESEERMKETECSYKFQLNQKTVCRDMFLRTLGITGRVLHRIRNLSTAKDKRGSNTREKRHRCISLTRTQELDAHIESFNPDISHYRRKHAPNRRYVDPSLTTS